ncbi:MAG: DNA mismatch repair protein MutS [Anaerolineae bacterium]
MRDSSMLRQWSEIKAQFSDCLIFFRLGDFYEAFNEDAERFAAVCDVVLTSRPVSKDVRIPMAGVPYHAVDGYIATLVRAGIKVAIVEQSGEGASDKRSRMSRPDAGDGRGAAAAPSAPAAKKPAIMAREVVRVVTPGTLLEGDLLEARSGNYLAALIEDGKLGVGLAHLDISTGAFAATDFRGPDAMRRALDEIARLRPAELIVPEAHHAADDAWTARLKELIAQALLPTAVMRHAPWQFEPANARRVILEHFGASSLRAYGCEERPLAAAAAGAALGYALIAQRDRLGQITGLSTYDVDDFMTLDTATRRNLEIAVSLRGDARQGTLLSVIDATRTAIGARTLRGWVDRPLLDRARIERRLDAVGALVEAGALRAALRDLLGGLSDIERAVNRVIAGYSGPRELIALARSASAVPRVADLVAAEGGAAADALGALCRQATRPIAQAILDTLRDDPPAALGAGHVIRPGASAELDGLHAQIADAHAWIAGLEERERERTGLRKLKVGFNKVFGYYLELPRSLAAGAPADYERRQTLVDAERYVTPALKEREVEVLGGEERIAQAERELYRALLARIAEAAPELLAAARDLGAIDAIAALAEVAERSDYVRPILDDTRSLDLTAARHPVVERRRAEEPFVPNDIALGEGEIVLLTGPNMAGKSTVGRTAALIVLLAQMGSFVPAAAARIGIVDRIFTRIGAQDELAAGQSTFMVEMVEAANILHHATPRSLILLDELGRGTSTYDGIAIAWAVVEYLHDHPRLGARTVFATHYHELTALAGSLPRVRNVSMQVAEIDGRVVFLHRLGEGAADRSYGVHVAELAGLPAPVIERAWALLDRLEQGDGVPLQASVGRPAPSQTAQLALFAPTAAPHPALEALRALDPDSLTPLDALRRLYELRRLADER